MVSLVSFHSRMKYFLSTVIFYHILSDLLLRHTALGSMVLRVSISSVFQVQLKLFSPSLQITLSIEVTH